MGRALLVIDMLVDFIYPQGSLYGGQAVRDIIPYIRSQVDVARKEGTQVIYVCDRHKSGDAEFSMFAPHCLRGSRGSDIIDELKPESNDIVIEKRRFSAFMGTDLDLTLRELSVDEIILVGVCTNICVLYTAADARMLGYKVRVLRNGVASFDQGAHEWALRELEKTLGCLVE